MNYEQPIIDKLREREVQEYKSPFRCSQEENNLESGIYAINNLYNSIRKHR